MVLNSYVIYKDTCSDIIKPVSRYQLIVSIINSIADDWFDYQLRAETGGGDTHLRQQPRGLEKLPGQKAKTCWVCTKKGKDHNKSRRKARTVCSWCKTGCHPECLVKHK